MSNQVYANSMEIACKAAAGKSAAAFPDTCLSPPTPPAGPVPLPYPNTAYASDTNDGTSTVMISGQMVMMKDSSVFKKSTGDEAATKSQGMGVVTHTIQGEASFISWSMDVQFEGANVPRHMDQMMHNEQSYPANTATWPYLDDASRSSSNPCDGSPRDPCELVPYSKGCEDSASGEKRTPHHLIPAHCFHPPGYGSITAELQRESYNGLDYQHSRAPCICVTGKDKNATGSQHQLMHALFDAAEDEHMNGNQAGTWSYGSAKSAALDASENVFPQCKPGCLTAQLDNYHIQAGCDDDNTDLRADSAGQGGDVDLPRMQVSLVHL
jgi:hypothetical protein